MWTTIIVAIIGSGLAVTLGYIFGRKKNAADINKTLAETEGLKIDNVEAVIQIWKELVQELRNEVATLTSEVSGLRAENISLKKEMVKLEKFIQQKVSQ